MTACVSGLVVQGRSSGEVGEAFAVRVGEAARELLAEAWPDEAPYPSEPRRELYPACCSGVVDGGRLEVGEWSGVPWSNWEATGLEVDPVEALGCTPWVDTTGVAGVDDVVSLERIGGVERGCSKGLRGMVGMGLS
ncbi:hypothetical protein [Myxococcus landrumensis]|uniref:Uncharacterized protein n=1 Tax=Myxococcus landrumensis TaxID=2813577 RepID=A0ABX7N1Q2_9BACT|nr:hypothetical protein [Myxococcus landrumus]QSQ12641.1 hypothetical protein JY572_30400 [Myxococcus landrumus]